MIVVQNLENGFRDEQYSVRGGWQSIVYSGSEQSLAGYIAQKSSCNEDQKEELREAFQRQYTTVLFHRVSDSVRRTDCAEHTE